MGRNRALGAATVMILKSIQGGSRFGLEIMDDTGLPSGTVYPTLTRLENRDFVESTWEEQGEAKAAGRPRRRYYAITPAGSVALEEALSRLGVLAGPFPNAASPERA